MALLGLSFSGGDVDIFNEIANARHAFARKTHGIWPTRIYLGSKNFMRLKAHPDLSKYCQFDSSGPRWIQRVMGMDIYDVINDEDHLKVEE